MGSLLRQGLLGCLLCFKVKQEPLHRNIQDKGLPSGIYFTLLCQQGTDNLL